MKKMMMMMMILRLVKFTSQLIVLSNVMIKGCNPEVLNKNVDGASVCISQQYGLFNVN